MVSLVTIVLAVFKVGLTIKSVLCAGRLALVVAADIAVYATKATQPTGGAGAVAILLGPNAPLVVDPGESNIYNFISL